MAAPPRLASTRYPYLPVRVEIRGRRLDLSAYLDTGYTGYLLLPRPLLPQAIGPPDGAISAILADGSASHAPFYLGTLALGGYPSSPARITISGTEVLLGRGVLDRFRVIFERGQQVIVEP